MEQNKKDKNYLLAPYPQNLWAAILGSWVGAHDLPHDIDDTLNYLHDLCGGSMWNAIELRYQEKLTLREMAERRNISAERCRMLLSSGIGKLQKWGREITRYGIGTAMIMQREGKLDLPVYTLCIPVKVGTNLTKHGFGTISQLMVHTKAQVSAGATLTPQGLNNVAVKMARWGLCFAETSAKRDCDSFAKKVYIIDTNISVRAKDQMWRNKIYTLEDLVQKSAAEIRGYRSIGPKAMDGIFKMLESYGLSIEGMPDPAKLKLQA